MSVLMIELSKYMLEFMAEYLANNHNANYGILREVAYNEFGEIFDDVMQEFNMDDIRMEAQDNCVDKIKELMWEREGITTTYQREDEIDREIDKLEEVIEKLGEEDEDN